MESINRREFLKYASATMAGLTLPYTPPTSEQFAEQFARQWIRQPADQLAGQPGPAALPATSLGRIATWWRQVVRSEPSQNATVMTSKRRDQVIPLYATVVGEAPWPNNPFWYQTDGGFIHSGYVQPVDNTPSADVFTEVAKPVLRVCETMDLCHIPSPFRQCPLICRTVESGLIERFASQLRHNQEISIDEIAAEIMGHNLRNGNGCLCQQSPVDLGFLAHHPVFVEQLQHGVGRCDSENIFGPFGTAYQKRFGKPACAERTAFPWTVAQKR